MRSDVRWLLVALVCSIAGCGVQVALTKRPGAATPPEQPSHTERCDAVEVLNGRAPHDWRIVGVIDLAAFSARALPRDDEAFLELVRPAVCEAGGDAVIAGVNGDGRYVLGTVIAWIEPEAPAERREANPMPEAPAERPEANPMPEARAPAAPPVARASPRPDCLGDPAC